jgi:dUTP pyrophosphatase
MNKLRFKKLNPMAYKPIYGTDQAAGADLRYCGADNITVEPHTTKMLGTGIAVEIPDGYVGLVFARSGIAAKRDLAPANKVGVIDSDYRGEIKVAIHNHGAITQVVDPAERIAQLVIVPYIHCEYEEVNELDDTDRGNGGFGSTGTN